jgi:putative membrane protein
MALLAFILALEVWPMATFIKWRIRGARGETIDATAAQTFARISVLEAILVVLMVLAATAMARGYGTAAGT